MCPHTSYNRHGTYKTHQPEKREGYSGLIFTLENQKIIVFVWRVYGYRVVVRCNIDTFYIKK